MKHIHHIVPKHAGGSNNSENLIELSVEDHAEAHRLLYVLHGNFRDKAAWKGLLAIWSKEDIIKELCSMGGKIGGPKGGKIAVETHKRNKTGLWREDKLIQKMGNLAGSSLGGSAAQKTLREEKSGIYGFSKEQKSLYATLGGKAIGSKNGRKLKEESRGIFDPVNRKKWCSLGGKKQKGWKKHVHSNGDWKMALPGSEKSHGLILLGYKPKT